MAADLAKLLRILRLEQAELGVLFVGERAIRALNHRYRRKDSATDVLSFPLRGGPFPHVQHDALGDIVISVPVADRQAAIAGQTLRSELRRLLIHGLLHLVGYDHELGPREARRMERRERELLGKVGA